MKNYTIVHVLLVLLLLLVYQCTQAQDYIMTAKGDSLAGEVKPFTFSADKKVQVMSADKKKSTFSIFQVREFVYKGERYEPVKFNGTYTFMKLLSKGYLSLYAFQHENQISYEGRYLLKRDGKGLEVPNLSFKKLMAKYLEDCSPVAKKISSGEYGKQHLDNIVGEYNKCIDNRTVDHKSLIIVQTEQSKVSSSWDLLEKKVTEKADFDGKSDAIDMIRDIKLRIARSEKIPNYLVEGLKNSLAATDLQPELEKAVEDLKNSKQ
jgi:hypothetical protein